MTEERIRQIFGVADGPYPDESMYVENAIKRAKQAVNEAIEEYKKKLLEEIDCCEPKDLTYPITFVYEDDINSIADQLKVK